ncbi:MAG: fructose 1,6-bisphosphatase [Thermoproteota archaeon]|jgi:myo-inositol-1(or 4)-monophosphatase|nr:fructose 1,6-bisphosphatase [Thermoproteota archaeon]
MIIDTLKQACQEVNAEIKGLAGTASAARQMGRGAGGDISRRIDLIAEKTVIDLIRKQGIEATIIGEECGTIEGKQGYIVMDAIDGTTNAIHGIPFFCCSIAYATDFSLNAVADAAIIDLARGDLYYASKNEGAFLNGKRISVKRESLSDSIIGVNMSGVKPTIVERLVPVIPEAYHIRQFGANALEMCFLARGFLDAYIDMRGKIRPTDIAAGYLIAREAGAKIYSDNGSSLDSNLDVKTRLSYAAVANDQIHKQLMSLFA